MKTRPIHDCRCDERLKPKDNESTCTRLAYTHASTSRNYSLKTFFLFLSKKNLTHAPANVARAIALVAKAVLSAQKIMRLRVTNLAPFQKGSKMKTNLTTFFYCRTLKCVFSKERISIYHRESFRKVPLPFMFF